VNATPRLLGGRYEIGDLLGRGGMAEVHIGRDARLGRPVAVKMLRADLARDPSFQARFRREAQSAAALNHPTVVAVYDSGEEPSADIGGVAAPYIVMEYVEGRTLRELLAGGQRMPWREALRLTSGVLSALAYSHRANLVHRDIKPANVMMTPAGDVKVMDFGIARAMADSSATMTQTQAVIGTAQYLSPEQARGETVDARSDLYSTGCLLYELLTGRPPFVADSPVAVAYQHVGEMPTPPSQQAPDVPEAVDAIVMHALVKDRAARYQSADEFQDDVQAALAGRRISAVALGSAALGAGPVGAPTERLATVPGGVAGLGGTAATSLLTLPPLDDDDLLPATRGGGRPPNRPNRTGLWVMLGLVGAALLAGAVLYVTSLQGTKAPVAPQQVAVPKVQGMSLDQARLRLASVGLTLGPPSYEASADVEKDKIIGSDPAEGVQVKKGDAVNPVVSSGPDTVDVPPLAGLSKDDAAQALTDAGLTLGQVSQVDSPDQEEGKVVSSTPAEKSPVAPGTQVSIQVSSGRVQVPNVIGKSQEDAKSILEDAGLQVDATLTEESTQAEGTVTQQDPGSDKTAKRGDTIRLVIATPQVVPPPTETIPTPSETIPPP
jgi:eukaryotic-like serine/threonine-protein kinase